ncbi:hypothetical protein PP175_21450 [Aneurinibacillus sp. Ricciae_BoGa-3]|uniref:hypothetical protein n=1 Tax=Aneurinibacillus sp. Ricciae_BoGa-3 TaxID=3022697 RepID=UPI002340880C|nr:hypothetical protein [Aneurinibacillus sp. Ricciae_BoGa-3]WCK53858.1 hypothetical protein PP175_21450 [Aneurinibacillus sp. Ricciae_BoGa-3]
MNADFRARVAGLNVTDKKLKLTLELDVEIRPIALSSITQMIGEDVTVNLGSPQMEMDFDGLDNHEMDFQPHEERTTYQTDASGVVVHVFPLPESKQEEQQKTEGENIIEGEFTVITDGKDMEQSPSEEEIEEFILSGHAPLFDDIPFDFPQLLHTKKNLGSWTKVAAHLGESVGKLRRDYNTYKERIAEEMRRGDTA